MKALFIIVLCLGIALTSTICTTVCDSEGRCQVVCF